MIIACIPFFIANPNNTDNGTSNAVNVNYTTGGLAKMESSPYFFARFGYVSVSTLYSVAGLGVYWSGSAVSSTNAYYLNYYSGELYPAYQYYRGYGWSVRCLARWVWRVLASIDTLLYLMANELTD